MFQVTANVLGRRSIDRSIDSSIRGSMDGPIKKEATYRRVPRNVIKIPTVGGWVDTRVRASGSLLIRDEETEERES